MPSRVSLAWEWIKMYTTPENAKRFGCALKKIGALRAEPGVVYNGEQIEHSGWDHVEARAAR